MRGPESGPADPYTQKWKGNVAICSIMKQEDPRDIEEFVRYYRCAPPRVGARTASPVLTRLWAYCHRMCTVIRSPQLILVARA